MKWKSRLLATHSGSNCGDLKRLKKDIRYALSKTQSINYIGRQYRVAISVFKRRELWATRRPSSLAMRWRYVNHVPGPYYVQRTASERAPVLPQGPEGGDSPRHRVECRVSRQNHRHNIMHGENTMTPIIFPITLAQGAYLFPQTKLIP